jgi:hypothetical protein
MDCEFSSDTLLILPCCKVKAAGGKPMPADYVDPMGAKLSPEVYAQVLRARSVALTELRSDPAFTSGDHSKNAALRDGPDFNGDRKEGRYLEASARYKGWLYSVHGFQSAIDQGAGAHILILSALYGPLHPLSLIQDYNLKMDKRPAKVWTRSFAPFLNNYARRSGITHIRLYVGSETRYFTVAKAAAETLLASGAIKGAVQYHVVNGTSRRTPDLHGARFVADLTGRRDGDCCDPSCVEERHCGALGKPWQTRPMLERR